jgi:hypothetical protein
MPFSSNESIIDINWFAIDCLFLYATICYKIGAKCPKAEIYLIVGSLSGKQP